MPPKSILKKTNHPANPPASKVYSREQRNREIALHHARLIQEQKDVEAQILECIENALELPHSPDADPARPSHSDASLFRSYITLFQPGDYDSLIEERHAADLCGYALCPRPPKRDNGPGKMRFLRVRGQGLKVVPKERLELWCSDDCARRAMYVKVQLNEEPAWLRGAIPSAQIDLLVDGGDEARTFELSIRPAPSNPQALGGEPEIRQSMAALALERGDRAKLTVSEDLMSSDIQERQFVKPPMPPAPAITISSHMDIEGHQPRIDVKDEKEQDEDGDWKI